MKIASSSNPKIKEESWLNKKWHKDINDNLGVFLNNLDHDRIKIMKEVFAKD